MASDRALPGEARAINIRADRWKQRILDDTWPHGLPEPPLWRRDVFELAEDWRAGRVSSRALLVAVCMWGTSLRDYGPSRTRAVLEVDVNGAKLDHNLEPSDHWVAYLRWATAQASNPLFGGEPDAVEMALFNGAWPQNS